MLNYILVTTNSSSTEIATLAGGCFWCTEAIFKRLKGVISVVAGYCGGNTENPTAEQVYNENTGHAEAIQIEFDPKTIAYEKLLDVFFHLHDPTTLNQQGADFGTEYRSAIFFHNENQKQTAVKVMEKITSEKTYTKPLVTEVVPFKKFYPADEYHQNFYEKGQRPTYCSLVIDPKIRKLFEEYPKDVKSEVNS